MRLSSDATGFPLLEWSERHLHVALLPIAKAQAERWLAEPGKPDDAWYESVLQANPRVSWRRFSPADRERLFLSGIHAAEACSLATWLGPDFDLLTREEWEAFDGWLQNHPFDSADLHACSMSIAARSIVSQLVEQCHPDTWRDLALTRGGLLEWVHHTGRYTGKGKPRESFQVNRWVPETDCLDPTTPERNRLYGARLVRREPSRRTTR